MNIKNITNKIKDYFKNPVYSFTTDKELSFSPQNNKEFKKALANETITSKHLGSPTINKKEMLAVDTLFYFNRFNRNRIYEIKSYRMDEVTGSLIFVFEDISEMDFKTEEIRLLFELSSSAINQLLVPIKENKIPEDSNPINSTTA